MECRGNDSGVVRSSFEMLKTLHEVVEKAGKIAFSSSQSRSIDNVQSVSPRRDNASSRSE